VTAPGPQAPRPASYLLIGPPDLLHDLMLDFEAVGWRMTAMRWQAVVTAPPDDAAAPAPDWPAEVTLAGVSHEDHEEACRAFFLPP
jgi:hypothetical protein